MSPHRRFLATFGLLALLSACAETPVSSDSSPSSSGDSEVITAFKALQKGYRAEVYYTQKIGVYSPTYYVFDVSSTLDKFAYEMYPASLQDGEFVKGALESSARYTSREGSQYLYGEELGLDNEISYYQVTYSTGELLTWAAANYDDLFASIYPQALVAGDYIGAEGHKYNYKLDLKTAYHGIDYKIGTQLAFNASLSASNFYLGYEDGAFTSFSVEFAEYSSSYGTVNIAVHGVFLASGEGVIAPLTPLEGEEDPAFQEAFKRLQGQNYRLDATLQNKTTKAQVQDGRIVTYTIEKKGKAEGAYGYYQVDDGHIQGIVPIDGISYYDAAPLDGSLSSLLPTFRLSSVLFDKAVEGDVLVYTLKDGLDGFAKDAQSYGAFAGKTCYDLTVTITGDEVTIVNKLPSSSYEETFRYHDIGGVDGLLDDDKIVESSDGLKWSSLLKNYEEAYAILLSKIPAESLDLLPTYGGVITYLTLNADDKDNPVIIYPSSDYDALTELQEAYEAKLVENGFALSSEAGPHKGNLYTKEAGETVVQAEVLLSAAFFETPYLLIYPSIK